MATKFVKVKGQRFVMVPELEFRRLERLAAQVQSGRMKLPPLPRPDAEGNFPALEFIRTSVARDIIRERSELGLSQIDLANLAGVRQETICRLETGKHSPTVRTVEKIDRALKRYAAKRRAK